jgi:hypothetical protein
MSSTPIVFYLSLDENLPKNYFIFDKYLKENGVILIPMKIDQVQTLASSSSQTHFIVLATVTNSKEYKLYNEKVRGLLKYILKSKRVTFMHISSFSKLNDVKLYSVSKNYFFLKCPFNVRSLASLLVRYYAHKTERNVRWPGGRRATVPATI